MESRRFLAFDLGASSGRGMLGTFDGNRLALEEIHRFANGPVRIVDSLPLSATSKVLKRELRRQIEEEV